LDFVTSFLKFMDYGAGKKGGRNSRCRASFQIRLRPRGRPFSYSASSPRSDRAHPCRGIRGEWITLPCRRGPHCSEAISSGTEKDCFAAPVTTGRVAGVSGNSGQILGVLPIIRSDVWSLWSGEGRPGEEIKMEAQNGLPPNSKILSGFIHTQVPLVNSIRRRCRHRMIASASAPPSRRIQTAHHLRTQRKNRSENLHYDVEP